MFMQAEPHLNLSIEVSKQEKKDAPPELVGAPKGKCIGLFRRAGGDEAGNNRTGEQGANDQK